MTTSILLFVVSSFLAVSIRAADIGGRSTYCERARLEPHNYGPTPEECCDSRGECEKYIRPNARRYGLKNSNPTWSKRLCSCDQILFECVMKNMSAFSRTWTMQTFFKYLTCFREKPLNLDGPSDRTEYEFVSFIDTMRISL